MRGPVLSSSAERAAAVLREQVVEGRLRAGTPLREERLAQTLGVSRNTLREGLSQLVAERILVRAPHRGVVVATPGLDDVRDVYRVRRILEPGAVRDSAPDRARLGAVRAAVEAGQGAARSGDWDEVASANQRFHRSLVAMAGSPRLDAQMSLLLAEMRLIFHLMGGPEDFHRPYLGENAAIADLLEAGRRAEAAERLAAYLRTAEEQLVARFAEAPRTAAL